MVKMSTPVLTRLLLEAVQFQSPKRSGMFRPKMRYAHQGGMNPPVIVVHGNSLEHVTDAYKRFLEGRFRKEFNLVGTPLRIEMKTSKQPVRRQGDSALSCLKPPAAEHRISVLRKALAYLHGTCRCGKVQFPTTFPNAEHGEYREQQRAASTRPLSEHLASRACAGVDLPGQRHQAARPDRVFRPVRRAACATR